MKHLATIILVSIIFLLFSFCRISATETSIVDYANNWLMGKGLIEYNYFEDFNDCDMEINRESYLTGTRKTIVYDKPFGNTIIIRGGQRNRYLGYTMNGARFTNYLYPDDAVGDTSYYNRGYNEINMVKEPWWHPKIKSHSAVISTDSIPADSKFCNKPEFEPYIKEGLRIRSRDEMNRQGIPVDHPTVDFTREQIESLNWYEYTYIIQPPTEYSWGSGVLFRDNGAGYLTIPIPPEPYNPDAPTPTSTPIPIPEPEVFEDKKTSEANCELYSNKYDVNQGIPTKENLFVKVRANNFIADINCIERTGREQFVVNVKRTYTFSDGDSITMSVPYTVEKDYSYYEIISAGVYGIEKAVIQKPENQKEWILPQSVTISPPVDYKKPEVELWHSKDKKDHIEMQDEVTLPSKEIDDSLKTVVKEKVWPTEGDAYEVQQALNRAGMRVKNDKLIIKEHIKNGTKTHVVLNDNFTDAKSDNPNNIESDISDIEFSYKKDDLIIMSEASNGKHDSICKVYYDFVAGINISEDTVEEDIELNSVMAHAPVVCDPTIENDRAHNQEIKYDDKRTAMILGRTSSLTFPTNGNRGKASNIAKKGYDGADYAKYTLKRTIKFPFDIYIDDKFYPQNTECTIDNSELKEIKLDIPTWIDEGNYEIECKAYAINSSDTKNAEENFANNDYKNYVALKNIPVRVIGRIYGLKITDINDYPDWAEVFRINTNSSKHSGNYYWVGELDQEGQVRGNKDKFTLPVLNGSHTTKTNLGAVKKGYKIKFDLTTIGNYFNDKDCVRIKPTFYYVKKDGTERQQVDLWYTERIDGINKVIKIGSKTDISNIRSIVLGEPYRNVSEGELKDTSSILGITKNEFTNQKAKLGSFGDVILSKPLRTFIGDTSNIPAGVDSDRVKKSVQKWYGEYWIPDNTFACQKDYNVASSIGNSIPNGKEDFWLKDGYLIVNFEIDTLKNADINNPQLSYWKSVNCNMWQLEGFNYTKKDNTGKQFSLKDGDVIFYYTDKKSLDDYSTGGMN